VSQNETNSGGDKVRKIILIFSLVFISGCSAVESENNSQAPDLEPLAPEQQRFFEESVDGAGRLERVFLQDGGRQDPLLDEIRQSVRAGCAIQDTLHFPTTAPQRKLFVGGSTCPLSVNVSKTNNRGDIHFSGSFVLENFFAQRNGIRSLNISGNARMEQSTAGFFSFFQTYTGNMLTARGQAVSFVGRTEWRGNSNTMNGLTGVRTLQFEMSGFRVELKMASDGFEAIYFLNSDRITPTQYESYLSRLGPLLSGLLNEAG
jgi:hypothetical protein